MKLNKIAYYLKSSLTIIKHIELFSLLKFTINQENTLVFDKKIKLKAKSFLDILLIKETMYDDVYRISNLDNPSFIIDIGAGLGDFTIFTAMKFPRVKILAFEPDKNYFNLLINNIKSNNIRNVKAYNFAIGKKGERIFYIAKAGAANSLIRKQKKREKVTSQELTNYITKPVSLLKMDCEGGEREIILSLKKAALEKINRISLEYHKDVLPNIDKELLHYLSKSNFFVNQVKDKFDDDYGYIYAEKTTYKNDN